MNLAKERIGEIRNNNYGSKMEIIEYNSSNDIWIRFIDQGNLVHTNWQCFNKGDVRNVYDRTFHGVGYIGDGIYKTRKNGKHIPQYLSWTSMLQRCYDKNYHAKRPTYKNCSVAEEWHNFQNFASWYDENYYEVNGERMGLDKDILVKENKIYSPETCIFVPNRINTLFVKRDASRGEFPLGVHFHKKNKKYIAQCRIGKEEKYTHIGCYATPEDAFIAYKIFKEKLIKEVAEEYRDKIPSKLYKAMLSYTVDNYQ